MTKIKICGLKRLEDVAAVNQFLPDYAGFVFASGKRQVTLEHARTLRAALKKSICPVGVFVDEATEKICQAVRESIIQAVQLHGDETADQVRLLKKTLKNTEIPIIKAISVTHRASLKEELSCWQNSPVDYLLLDAGKGGTGKCFDHQLLEYLLPLKKPWFLAGGITDSNVVELKNRFKPYCIDVSSGVETDGYKDEKKMESIIRRVRYE